MWSLAAVMRMRALSSAFTKTAYHMDLGRGGVDGVRGFIGIFCTEKDEGNMRQRLTLWLPIILFLLFAAWHFGVVVGQSGARDTQAIGFSREGQVMPTISLPLLGAENQQLSLTDWQGRAYAINVWASWCLPCVPKPLPLPALPNPFRFGH